MFGSNLMDFDHDFESLQSSSNGSSMTTIADEADNSFIEKHNISVNAYQRFNGDVDLTFSGNFAFHDHPSFLNRVRNHCESAIIAFESEKQYLLSDVLCQWARKQQKLSIGGVWTQLMHYNQLQIIDNQFEYFGELLEQTLTGLEMLIQAYPNNGFDELYLRLKRIAHYFLFFSVIISKQPPSVIVKCGVADKNRRSRFWFNTEIRILGGRAFGIHLIRENVLCYLITDGTAEIVLNNANHEISENEEFLLDFLDPPVAFTNMDNHGIAAQFDDMRISKKDTNQSDIAAMNFQCNSKKGFFRRERVAARRYCLCYNIHINVNHGINLIGKKLSLPFAILCGPNFDAEARIFLERSFADLVRKLFSDEFPTYVSYTEMANALEMKFQSIIETPPKHTNIIDVIQPKPLSHQAKDHIISRLKPDNSGRIKLENFMKVRVAEEFKKNPKTDGEWEVVSFYEWYFKCADLINKHLFQMWNDG